MIKFWAFIIKLITPFVKWWGSLHFPFTRRKITGVDYYNIRSKILPGDVFLTSIRGEPSNLINPCEYKHGAIYLGEDADGFRWVLEAVGGGVRKIDLVTFLTTKDVLVVLKPKFLGMPERLSLAEKSAYLIGLKYDYDFSLENTAYYCFEAVIASLKTIAPSVDFKKFEFVKDLWIYDHRTFLEDEMRFEKIYSKGTKK